MFVLKTLETSVVYFRFFYTLKDSIYFHFLTREKLTMSWNLLLLCWKSVCIPWFVVVRNACVRRPLTISIEKILGQVVRLYINLPWVESCKKRIRSRQVLTALPYLFEEWQSLPEKKILAEVQGKAYSWLCCNFINCNESYERCATKT